MFHVSRLIQTRANQASATSRFHRVSSAVDVPPLATVRTAGEADGIGRGFGLQFTTHMTHAMTFPISASPTWRKAHGTLTAVALATSMLCAAHLARAQAQSSPSSDLASELQRRFDDQQAEIARYLANNPGVQREVLRDGAVYRIVRIGSDGQPIYIKNKGVTFNSRSNVESGQLIKADSLYPGGSLGVNITGQNMVVGVWEPGVPRATHELLAGKITIEANQLGSTTDSARNHATHVTRNIVGRTLDEYPNTKVKQLI